MIATVCLSTAGVAMAAKSRKPTDTHFKHAIKLIAKGDHAGGIIELKTRSRPIPRILPRVRCSATPIWR